MAEIIVGEKVVNKIRETGTIVSFDDNFIYVEFKNRVAKLQLDAFWQKFIRYENADLQRKIDEAEEAIKSEIARQEEERLHHERLSQQ